jgi:hypothetical protein
MKKKAEENPERNTLIQIVLWILLIILVVGGIILFFRKMGVI